MGVLKYVTNMSLDGFIEDDEGRFDWLPLDDELFDHQTELVASADTLLYGRRLYESMAVWETDAALGAQNDRFGAFSAAWKAAHKVVYSTSLAEVGTADTRIERRFVDDEVRRVTHDAPGDVLIGGADLAARAFAGGLVDECLLFVFPVSVGGGKPALPRGQRVGLELLGERRFSNGVLLLHHRVRAR